MACNESLTGSSSGVCLAISVDTDPDNSASPMARRVDSMVFCGGVLAGSVTRFLRIRKYRCPMSDERCVGADIYGRQLQWCWKLRQLTVSSECSLYACQGDPGSPECPSTCTPMHNAMLPRVLCCESTGQRDRKAAW